MAKRPTNDFNVYLNGKFIDRVFYNLPSFKKKDLIETAEVKKSLVEHDGYDPTIRVRRIWMKK